MTGMTFDRWSSSRERFTCEGDEWVLEKGGTIIGWLKRTRQGGTALVKIDAHPEHEGSIETLLDFCLSGASTEEVRCIAGAHQIRLGTLMAERGFDPVAEFITLAKRNVIPARDDTRVRTTIGC